jgi:hypothetical protein
MTALEFIIKSILPFSLKTTQKTASRVHFSSISTPFSLEKSYTIAPSDLEIFSIDCPIPLLAPITIRTFLAMFFRVTFICFPLLSEKFCRL